MILKNILLKSIYFALVTFTGIFFLIMIRFIEFILINVYNIQEISTKILFKDSINLDIHFGLTISTLLLFPYLLSVNKFPIFVTRFYKFIWTCIIIITICFTHFFISSEYLLTNVIFDFSWEEIKHVITIEGGTNNYFIWIFYLLIPIAFFVFHKLKMKPIYSKYFKISVLSFYFVLIFAVLINHKHYYKSSIKFNNQYEFYLANNKITHFLLSVKRSIENQNTLNLNEVKSAIKTFQKENTQFQYTSKKFPFLRTDSIKNVLGEYFIKSDKAPNIVMIVAEGLGGSIAGNHPASEHVLPYIDTLAMNGLYWQNFLSNCYRTFGVFPNVLGSLTPGTIDRGFINFNGEEKISKRYPLHNSLIKELKRNNYFTSFFYGGWGEFDSYSNFLKEQKIDLFVDQSKFDSSKYLAPWKRKPGGFYLGYDDFALFNQWFDYTKKHKINQPYLNIYLTLNMHEPYNMASKKYYNENFIKNRLKGLKLKTDYFTNKDKFTLGSMFYFEDALRIFMNNYKKRPDYENTIFMIFGDHYSLISHLNNPIGVYHVPMIIYSPLLKTNKVFKGVSTHLDIAPSILALLQGNFGIKISKAKPWIGKGLDTSTSFKCDHITPLSLYSGEHPTFIYKDYFLTQDGVYKLSDDLKATLVHDKKIIKKVNAMANKFKMIDKYVCEKDKIWKGR